MARNDTQLRLALLPTFGWGGARDGAGRRPRGERPGVAHAPRPELDRHLPLHVTLRTRAHVWNLRTRRCHGVIAAALRGVLARGDFRVVHFSIQGNHLHLVVEAEGAAALARGMRALSGRIALGLDRLMRRRGRVFTDRYHAHVLRTPAAARRAVAYVLGNFASHVERRGGRVPDGWADPHSSVAERGPDGLPPPVSRPSSWLLGGAGLAREREAEYGRAAWRPVRTCADSSCCE